MTLGELVVSCAMGAAGLGVVYSVVRYDLVDPRDAPGYRDIRDALRHGKPLPSQWKRFDDNNRVGYAILVLSFWVFGTLIFAHNWLAQFIDQF
ncbi:hypothetical protein [Mesorhizobium sp. LjNodule214]|uniref:hypothetical protein n=1 Tax=Mesorhizobium sp. LjNodule214 TaxID=3342252 RepID=UPI003ECD417E